MAAVKYRDPAKCRYPVSCDGRPTHRMTLTFNQAVAMFGKKTVLEFHNGYTRSLPALKRAACHGGAHLEKHPRVLEAA